MKILTRNGYIDGVALFFELSDEQLERVKQDKLYCMDAEFTKLCVKSKGDNAHIYHLCNSAEPLNIQDFIKDLLKQYKTVSWMDKDNDRFEIIRR